LSKTHHAIVSVRPAGAGETLAPAEDAKTAHVQFPDETTIACESLERDVFGAPAFVLTMSMERGVYTQGLVTWRHYSTALVAIGIVGVALILLLLEQTVLAPLSRLSHRLNAIGRRQDFSVRLDPAGRDELGILSFEINQMLEQLETARGQLLARTHALGKAQMAAEVVHQVRHALMPISGSVNLILDHLRSLPLNSMAQAIDELDSGFGEVQRQQDLNRFLELALRQMVRELSKALAQLEQTRHPIANLETVLAGCQQEIKAIAQSGRHP
jgi:methyl-accepting chemotaxis protein